MVAQLPPTAPAQIAQPVFTRESAKYFLANRLDLRSGTYRVPCSPAVLDSLYPHALPEPARSIQLARALQKVDETCEGQWVRLSRADLSALYLQNQLGFADLVTYEVARYDEIRPVSAYFQALAKEEAPKLTTGIIELTFASEENDLIRGVMRSLITLLTNPKADSLTLNLVVFPARKSASLRVALPRELHLEALRLYVQTVAEHTAQIS